ncbi:hypothetical protein MAR_003235 [Mya arenaria]|uniref:Uncharacterized protein n=1 Tax=Mya arenaria TaxID=6604 RepID=A0ABY7G8J5_MYAAR|nr:hypothetical protein MAR_003235 [Mya arenaria]
MFNIQDKRGLAEGVTYGTGAIPRMNGVWRKGHLRPRCNTPDKLGLAEGVTYGTGPSFICKKGECKLCGSSRKTDTGLGTRSICSRKNPIPSVEEICIIPKDVDIAKLHSCLDASVKINETTYSISYGCFTIPKKNFLDRIVGEEDIPIKAISSLYGFNDSPKVVDDNIDGSTICHKGILCVIAKALHNAMEVELLSNRYLKDKTVNARWGCFKIPNKVDEMQTYGALDSDDINVETDYMDSENIDALADSSGSDKEDVEADTLELDVFSPFGAEKIVPSTRLQKAMLTFLKSLQQQTAL